MQTVAEQRIRSLLVGWWTVLLVATVFGLLACGAVPDVNEAHYWAKAKRFWDPSFGSRDLFLNSADAHWSFYVTLGQGTRCWPLETATWLGRILVWLAIAGGWTLLGRTWQWPWWRIVFGAALFVVLTRWCHLSGEWVIGGAEAKGLAFAAVFAAVAFAQQGRWPAAFWAGGLGAGLHVLVGGWTVVCLGLVGSWQAVAVLRRRRPPTSEIRTLLLGVMAGGLCSLPGLLPALALTSGLPPEVNRQATDVYVLQRLPHHLLMGSFSPYQLLPFCTLLLVWLALLSGERRQDSAAESWQSQRVLIQMVHAALGLAAVGCGLSVILVEWDAASGWVVGLLRYYWFRTADVLLPLGVVFGLLSWVQWPRRSETRPPAKFATRAVWTWVASYGLATVAIGWEASLCYHKFVIDGRPLADQASLPSDPDPQRTAAIYGHWRAVCEWVRQHTEPDALFLTPRGQQTFKWYALRSEVVSWKDVPQDSRGLLEWRRRVDDCGVFWQSDLGLAIQDPVVIHELVEKYGVDYLVMPQYAYELQQRFGRALPYRRVYPARAAQRTYYVVLDTRQWQP